MKNFFEWRQSETSENNTIRSVKYRNFVKIIENFLNDNLLTEAVKSTRYSIEVNYHSTVPEVLDAFAKITLGYVSAALKNHGFHTKHVFNESPLRLLISKRNWDDGEWTGVVTWNKEHNCFVISRGFYNKMRKTVSIQHSKKCDGNNAAEISKELHNTMHKLQHTADRREEDLKPVPLKRGPRT